MRQGRHPLVERDVAGIFEHVLATGWLVRHGGRGQRLTVVFRPDLERSLLFIALIAFGGRNWIEVAEERSGPPERG